MAQLDTQSVPARAPEAVAAARFSDIRYAQCWEDADVLLAGLDVHPGDTCLSIASAGDNTLALLTRAPARVVAVDLSPAQLACLELRVAAYRALSHPELLVLIGSRPGADRLSLYGRCRPLLAPATRAFWDARPRVVAAGIGSAGKFERYLAAFRRFVLPLVHDRRTITRLLAPAPLRQRRAFYAQRWDTWRWRALFRVFFSRALMGRLGRDPTFFRYVQGDVAGRILSRTRYALTELDPAANPYVRWILTGAHGDALPYALRPEHFDTIRANLDRLEWRHASLESYLSRDDCPTFDRHNLSDVFEYMSPEQYTTVLRRLAEVSRPGARLLYWNMLAPRSCPPELAARLHPCAKLAARLHAIDRAFFYSALVIEEVV